METITEWVEVGMFYRMTYRTVRKPADRYEAMSMGWDLMSSAYEPETQTVRQIWRHTAAIEELIK